MTPVGGRGREDRGLGFDQQPLKPRHWLMRVLALFLVDGSQLWRDGITAAVDWFLGGNDSGVVMWNPQSGGAFDGLQPSGANLNQGSNT